jgi:PIN domain nuclease of toxin-antitoxin system
LILSGSGRWVCAGNDHLEETIDQFVLDSTQKLAISSALEWEMVISIFFESTQETIVIAHQAETVKKRLHTVSLLCKVNFMLAFQRQHYNQLSHNIGKFRDP